MRVLLTARVLDSGGVPPHVMTLGKSLEALGVQVALASGRQIGVHSHGPEWFASRGIQHFHVLFPSQSASLRNVRDAVGSLGTIRRVVATFRPDLLHVHYRSTSPYAEYIRRSCGIPFVSTLHLEGILSGRLYRMGSFWGSMATAVSSEVRDYLVRAFHVPPERIRLLYNGVDETHFRPPSPEERHEARARLGVGTARFVVSLIGRLEPVKGHDVLLRALRRLCEDGCDVVAIMAGEGSRRGELQSLAAELGAADRVRFPGYSDSRTVLWASDVLALPSRREGFALVVVEAMMCGIVPVRTPAAGASDQIENGVNGFIVPFEDDEALAHVLRRLIDDDELRTRVSAAAVERARRDFSQRRMGDETLKVYEEVLARHRTARGDPVPRT